ncbi:TetR family transcriptional regulator [Aliihoeflea sp. PC F10.4]
MNQTIAASLEPGQSETVERILETGERMFRHYGYSKTTVADIARDLGMSSANIYRFFASKVEIHQAICGRMLAASLKEIEEASKLPLPAPERLARCIMAQFRMTVDAMLDEQKVHEMVIVAIERDWHVIERHIDRIHAVYERVIREGIEAGEFRKQDAEIAARCLGASTAMLCHPQMVAQCLSKENRATPEQLIDFAIRALG